MKTLLPTQQASVSVCSFCIEREINKELSMIKERAYAQACHKFYEVFHSGIRELGFDSEDGDWLRLYGNWQGHQVVISAGDSSKPLSCICKEKSNLLELNDERIL